MAARETYRQIDAKAVGGRILQARQAAGLSQRQLAFPGCSAAYLSRLEAGERNPSGHLLRELGARLGVTASWLETGETSGPQDLLARAQAAMVAAVEHASPARDWVAIPHEQWRDLLAALPVGPDVQPKRP